MDIVQEILRSGVANAKTATPGISGVANRLPRDEAEVENDFQEKCRKGAKSAAHTVFSAILGEISCLFLLALEFFTRFRGGSFQPLTHLSGSCQPSAISPQPKRIPRFAWNDKGLRI
jgi:hypothetical protein